MNYPTKPLIAGLLCFSLVTGIAEAQNFVSFDRVIKSLGSTSNTARRVGVDTEAVRRDIEARIKAEGTENAKKPFSVLKELQKLPQLVVQIQFNLNSDVIRPESWVIVGRIADALHHPLLAGNRFLLVGHTDAQGKRLYNLKLSQKRALSVAGMLISTFRVNPKRLLAMGLGEEQLFNKDKPKSGVNRRVEFLNLGPL